MSLPNARSIGLERISITDFEFRARRKVIVPVHADRLIVRIFIALLSARLGKKAKAMIQHKSRGQRSAFAYITND